MHWEISEVLPSWSVAVAVKNWPTATGAGRETVKLTVPLALVVTTVEPTGSSPSPNPDGSQARFTKNSRVKEVVGVLVSVP
jgi:hypothetical protein